MRSNRIWVVEMWNTARQVERWEPTVGAALTRDDGRILRATWKRKNPGDRFRVLPYIQPKALK